MLTVMFANSRSSKDAMTSPPAKDATKEEHKSFVETVEAALNRANKSIGLQGATEKSRENTSAAVQAAKDSDFAEESMQKLHASWDSFASHCLPIAEGYNQVQDQTADMLKGLSDAATESADATRSAIEDFKDKESQESAPESAQFSEAKSSTTKTIGGAVNSAYKWTVDTAVPAVSDKVGQVADYFAPSQSKPGSESADDAEANDEKNQSGSNAALDQDEAENSTTKAIGEDVVDTTQGLLSSVSEWAGNTWQNLKDSEAVNATSNAIVDFKGNENEDTSPETDVEETTSKSGTVGGAMNSAYQWTVDTAVPAVSEKAGRIAHHFAPVRSKSGSVFADDADANDEEEQSGGNAASDQYRAKNSTIGETMNSGHKCNCAPRRSRSFASSRSGSDFAQLISA